MAGNPITQADVFRTLPNHYDTVGSESGGPNAEVEADRILLVHELGHVMASERFFTRRAAATSGNIAQSTSFSVTRTGFANGPFRINEFWVLLEAATAAADWSIITVSLLNLTDLTTEIPIFSWNVATGTAVNVRAAMGGVAVATRILLINELPSFPPPLLNGSDARPSPNVFEGIVMRGTTAAFGAGTREVKFESRISSMLNQGLPGLNGSYGLPLTW